jgi:hypothetical protein
MFKRTILALSVAALTFTGVASAQENATLTLRNGDKVTGQLVDLGGVGFTVKVNGAERNIPTNDVAVIDFAGGTMTDADWNKVSGGSQVVWLKSGETVSGQLFDIGGTSPLKITFKTASGDREFSSSELAASSSPVPPTRLQPAGRQICRRRLAMASRCRRSLRGQRPALRCAKARRSTSTPPVKSS